jgi:PAS domain S-box-containing protein
VESVQDYAIYLLAPDGTIQSWNAGAQRLKGYTADEITGRNFAQFFSPEDRSAGKPQSLLSRALADGRVEDVGWRFRKDGSQFWASAVITTLRDATGKHIGFAKVTRDLTDRGYRAFVEASHAIVWTTDASGHPNADSPSWRDFTGQSNADWRSHGVWPLIHPEDAEAFRGLWGKTATRFEVELRVRRADGEYAWMQVNAIPFLDVEGRVREWFGVMSDISARKLAEVETQRALELWRTTLRSIGDAVISTDAAGNVRFMNPVAERLTGWTASEAMGLPLKQIFPISNEETGAIVENPVEKVLRIGAVVGLANHTVLRHRTGILIPIDDSAAPIFEPDGGIDGVVLVFRDASDEKRESARRAFLANATQQLAEAADYKDALAKIAQLAVPRLADWVGIDIIDADGRPQQVAVAHVDPAKVQLARELARRYPPDPNSPSGAPNVIRTGKSELYPEISKAMLERAAVDANHLHMIRALDLRSALIVPLPGNRGPFGALTLVYAESDRRYTQTDLDFAEDLARRAALLIERRRLEEEAETANRMKDEFLATVSHELRTPLQAILGYGSMLKRGIARDTEKAIDAIVRNADAQARLIEDILDVSRITSGKLRLTFARIDLASAVLAALDSIRPTAQARRLRIVEDLPADLGTIHGDFDRIQQIIWNLLSNAVKFTNPDGTIEVIGRRIGSTIQITVRDTGKGIPREHLATIFERFRQLDSSTTRQRGGLGLGLAIVRYLAEAHGGTIKAESEGPGHGASFTVALPASIPAVDETHPTGPLTPLPTARPLRGIRILIVDDDDDARELIADVLLEAGADVTKASSAAQAYALLQTNPPHILISDIGMPDEDGYSLLRRVRALPPQKGGDVPAIALTAYARPEDVRAAADAGFQLHIVKPVKPEALLGAISAWANR